MKFLPYLFCAIFYMFFPREIFAASAGVVTTTVDQGNYESACTLRDAITALNSGSTSGGCDPAPDRIITFDVDAMGDTTITLNGTNFPTITSEVTIDAENNEIVLDANEESRHFIISGSGGFLTLNGLTIINGSESAGGAINGLGSLTITNSSFSSNSASSQGHAIVIGGLLTISDSTFSDNSGAGGGVVVISGGPGATISGSTFADNTAGSAGVIYVNSAPSEIANSTFYNNSGGSFAGAILNLRQIADAEMVLKNNTFVGNSATTGGTILSTGTGAVITMNENIIEKDSGDNSCSAASIGLGTGTITGSNNLTDDSSCTAGMGFTEVADLMLGTLEDNGGETETVLPETGSPAIDAVNPIGGSCLEPEDQRGVTRPQGAKCDIGSVEAEQAAPTPTPTPNPTPTSAPTSNETVDPCPGFTVCPNVGPITEMTVAIGNSGNRDIGEMLISENASSIDLTVSVQEASPAVLLSPDVQVPLPWQQGLNTVSEVFNFSAVSSFNGYPVKTLEKPAIIILSYDPAKLQGRNPNSLRIAFFDQTANRWKTIPANTVVNPKTNTIANTTTVFSYYTVVYPQANNYSSQQTSSTIQNEEKKTPSKKPTPKKEVKKPTVKEKSVETKQKEKRCFLWFCF